MIIVLARRKNDTATLGVCAVAPLGRLHRNEYLLIRLKS